MKIYKSYGVLAHEKEPVYSADCPRSAVYDVITVELPEGWDWALSVSDETLICSPDGDTYLANDLLTTDDDEPAIVIPSPYRRKPLRLSIVDNG